MQSSIDIVKQMVLCQLVGRSPLCTLCLLIARQPAKVFSSDAKSDRSTPSALSQQPLQVIILDCICAML